ncbi:hypothetical protein AAMO2058_000744000 [Amorphochlora amoebiformis]
MGTQIGSKKLAANSEANSAGTMAANIFKHTILVLKSLVGTTPSVWVVDDAHNIDTMSLRYIPHVLMIMSTPQVLIITLFALRPPIPPRLAA